ncbi:MAG: acyltransferase family protein [Clostridia bacterium]|nr:acyltransferase family protein [Clostridia bacterium]
MGKERNVGIDLLRILAMCMVVFLHVLAQGGVINNALAISKLHYYTQKSIQTIAYCAVNCYAIISGFVGVGRKWKISSLISLLFTVLFYTVGFSFIFYILKPQEIGLVGMFKAMLPDYWYVMAYCGLFFFMPILNRFIETASRETCFASIGWLFLVLSCTSPIFAIMGQDPFHLSEGFSMLWLMVLYLVGGYLKIYGINVKHVKAKMWILFAVCIAVTFLSKVATNVLGYPDLNILYYYTSPTIFLASIALVVIFSNLNIKSGKKQRITYFATFTFAIYLIHQQELVNLYCIQDQFVWVLDLHWALSIAATLGCAIAVCIICTIIDIMRFYLFKLCRVDKLVSLCQKIFDKIDAWIFKKIGIKQEEE